MQHSRFISSALVAAMKVGVFYTGVYKRVHCSAVSGDCHDVVFFHRCFENALFGVDKRQVIALRRELPYKCDSDFSSSGNNNFQNSLQSVLR